MVKNKLKNVSALAIIGLISATSAYADMKNNQNNFEEMEFEDEPHKNEKYNAGGMLGAFRAGFTIGAGILQGPVLNIETKWNDYIGLSFGVGGFKNFDLFKINAIKTDLNKNSSYSVNSLKLSYNQWEFKGSVYPFRGAFFVGAAVGNRTIQLNSDVLIHVSEGGTNLPIDAEADIQVKTTYLTPQIGWLAVWNGKHGGFVLGTEFGMQIPITNSNIIVDMYAKNGDALVNQMIVSSAAYQSYVSQIDSTITGRLQQYPMPYWTIIRAGWMF